MIDALATLYQAINSAYELMKQPVRTSIEEQIVPALRNRMKVGGADITDYATAPGHEAMVQSIYQGLQKRKLDPEAAIRRVAPSSPLSGGMVLRAADRHGVDPNLILAIMQADSSFGTAGKGKRTMNPGNVGNMDDGSTRYYPDWESGVNAVAEWLAKRKKR